ncbi:hypothetical protein SAMN06264364_1742 [Quadrisphaera granulorum]|uniref:Serine hydrolase family protein n=1 Tax=Quadrisphaera granulorum TaxID=317664 RepID=A0A315ZCH8_9ACTN|nr:alpha/beta hydrolase [Quadrisphaera granulorum]PWJ42444.1 hypothetical protein BXY45_1742 [Quadrisphaera granulorum]SZE99233.1 hypothetical protein SAMN06264364_1742 [Quadrisphaera granulorum]
MISRAAHQRAVIIHGFGATPQDHWFDWLADQLEADGIPTAVPALPNPLDPDPNRWEQAVAAELGTPDEHSIVVAHSLGCLTLVRYLRSLPDPWQLGTLVLVSGFLERLPALPELDGYIGDGCDVEGLQVRIRRLVVIRSDEDPFVPPALTDHVADLLGVPVRVVPGAGHFLASDGITAVPAVYEAITG